MLFCSYFIFTHRPMTDLKIGAALVGIDLALTSRQFHQKIHLTWRKQMLPEVYKALKPFWLLNWVSVLSAELSQCPKSMFSSSEPVAALQCPQRLPPTWKRPVFVLARPTRPSCERATPRAWPLISPSNLRLPSGTVSREITRWPAGAQTWFQTLTLPPDQRVVKFL